MSQELIIALIAVGNVVLLALGFLSWRLIFSAPAGPIRRSGSVAAGRPVAESEPAAGPNLSGEGDPLAGLFRYDSWDGGGSEQPGSTASGFGGVR